MPLQYGYFWSAPSIKIALVQELFKLHRFGQHFIHALRATIKKTTLHFLGERSENEAKRSVASLHTHTGKLRKFFPVSLSTHFFSKLDIFYLLEGLLWFLQKRYEKKYDLSETMFWWWSEKFGKFFAAKK